MALLLRWWKLITLSLHLWYLLFQSFYFVIFGFYGGFCHVKIILGFFVKFALFYVLFDALFIFWLEILHQDQRLVNEIIAKVFIIFNFFLIGVEKSYHFHFLFLFLINRILLYFITAMFSEYNAAILSETGGHIQMIISIVTIFQ